MGSARTRRLLTALSACAGCLGLSAAGVVGAGQAGAATPPVGGGVPQPPPSVIDYSTPAGGGFNDWSCSPSAAHPDPVVLLHGGFATYYEDLVSLQADLASQGYCTYSLTYGEIANFPFVGGLGPIAQSGTQIGSFIQQVRASTGAPKVDIVGHSEGGFMSLWVPKFDVPASEIGSVVSIAPPTQGLGVSQEQELGQYFLPGGLTELAAIEQQMGANAFANLAVGSSAVDALNTGPIAQPGIRYTILVSNSDEIVTPPADSFVAAANVTNERVQDSCPNDPVGHIGEAYDTNVWQLVTNALDPATAQPIADCTVGAPF